MVGLATASESQYLTLYEQRTSQIRLWWFDMSLKQIYTTAPGQIPQILLSI